LDDWLKHWVVSGLITETTQNQTEYKIGIIAMELELNAPLVSLGHKESASMPFAPAAGLLVVVQNQASQFAANATYGLGVEILGNISMSESNEDLCCETFDSQGNAAFKVSNTSESLDSVVGASLFGMGESSEGYISVGGSSANIGQLQSLIVATEPQNICLNLWSENETVQTIYLFEPGQAPTPHTLKPVSSGSAHKTDAKQSLTIEGNWQGNALFLVNVSSDPDSQIMVNAVASHG